MVHRPHQHYEKYQITTSRRLDGDSFGNGDDSPVLHADFKGCVRQGNGLVGVVGALSGDGQVLNLIGLAALQVVAWESATVGLG